MENNMNELNLEDLNKVAGGAGKKRKKTKKKLPVEVFSGKQGEVNAYENLKDFYLDTDDEAEDIAIEFRYISERDNISADLPPLNGIF